MYNHAKPPWLMPDIIGKTNARNNQQTYGEPEIMETKKQEVNQNADRKYNTAAPEGYIGMTASYIRFIGYVEPVSDFKIEQFQ